MPRPPTPSVPVLVAACVVASSLAFSPAAYGDEGLPNGLHRRLSESLAIPGPVAVEATRRETLESLAAVRRLLADQAIGVVLQEELGIDTLAAALATPSDDAAALDRCERRLRRVLAGQIRAPVNRLRANVERLARQVRLATEGPEPAREALRLLSIASPSSPGSDDTDDPRREAFRTLAAFSPDRVDLAALRRRISAPNASTTVSAALVEKISRKSFELPVDFRTSRDGATIVGQGRVRVSLHATAPPSEGTNRITLHAQGGGSVDASADRRRVHVRAMATPAVSGSVDLDLRADRIDAGSPHVDADFHTRLTGLGIDGVVGRCRLVQRLASDAITRALAAGDPTVAKGIETEIGKRIDDEGYDLAHRISALLHEGLWDRLVSLDETPEVRTWNDADGLHAATTYGHDDRLGALCPPPTVHDVARFAILTRLHESALNNTLADLGGLSIDENTARGIWEVQLKLTSDQWATLPPGRVPVEIRLAPRDPAVVRFREGAIDVLLHVVKSTPDGSGPADTATAIRFRYRLEPGPEGLRLLRSGFDHGDGPPQTDTTTIDRTLGLIFPASLVPMHRYRPSGFSEYLKVSHLDLADGWMTVGATPAEASEVAGRPGRADEVSR